MARTIFDWQGIEDAASELPDGRYLLTGKQVAFLLATVENKSIFRGNWEINGEDPTDAEWDEIEDFVANTERAIMQEAPLVAGFRVYKTSSQSLAPNTYTKITWQGESFDVEGDFDFANDRFVASKPGFYFFYALVRIGEAGVHGKSLTLNLDKNGSQIVRAARETYPISETSLIFVTVDMDTGDFLQLFGQQDSSSALSMWAGIHTQFSGFFIGS